MNLQKQELYRSRKLLNLAKEAPYCMSCEKINDGTIVAAHYTGIRQHSFGKGMGQKCTDTATAFLCNSCHESFDRYADSRDIESSESFLFAIVKTHDWLFNYQAKNSFEKWTEGLSD